MLTSSFSYSIWTLDSEIINFSRSFQLSFIQLPNIKSIYFNIYNKSLKEIKKAHYFNFAVKITLNIHHTKLNLYNKTQFNG